MCAAGCGSPSTLVELAADSAVSNRLDAYCLALGADGIRRYGARHVTGLYPLPQSLGVRSDGHATAVARLDAFSKGARLASQSALIDFTTPTVSITVAACAPQTPRIKLNLHETLQVPADRLAALRTGAEGPGAAELVAMAGTSGARYRFENGTSVALSSKALGAGLGSPVAALLALDVDDDCADDLLVLAADRSPQIWPSATDGDLAPDLSRIGTPSSPLAAATADVDGDGRADLITAGDEGMSVLLGNGQGFAERVGAIDVQPSGARAVAAGDLDSDGRVDVLVGQAAGPLRWYRGDGSGLFHLAAAPLPGAFEVSQILLRDVDADGDLDAIVAVRNATAGLHVFINDGGTFTDRATVVPAGLDSTVLALIAADLDGDCVDELVVLGSASPPRWLAWPSLGPAGMLIDRGPIGPKPAVTGTAADLDGDGVVDLALAVDGAVTTYSVSP